MARVVAAYEESGRSGSGVVEVPRAAHLVVSPFQIQRIEVIGRDGRATPVLKYGEPARIRLSFVCAENMSGVASGIALKASGIPIATVVSESHSVEASDALIRCSAWVH